MTNPDPNDVIGSRVRDARRRADLSVPQLAERCTEFGPPSLTATAIYLIEGGGRGRSGKRSRRRVTVDELFVLALALQLSPLALLLPERDVGYAITGTDTARARHVYEWLIGRRLPPQLSEPISGKWATPSNRHRALSEFTRMVSYAEVPVDFQAWGALVDRVDALERERSSSGKSEDQADPGR